MSAPVGAPTADLAGVDADADAGRDVLVRGKAPAPGGRFEHRHSELHRLLRGAARAQPERQRPPPAPAWVRDRPARPARAEEAAPAESPLPIQRKS